MKPKELPLTIMQSFPLSTISRSTIFLNKKGLNDHVRNLNLPKESAKLLAYRLNNKDILTNEFRVGFYCNRHQEFILYFIEEKKASVAMRLWSY